MSQVNISSLRSYLQQIVANQIKTTQPSYANQVSLVNAVTTTSSYMNINPNTGTIIITPATGTTPAVTVPQPVITPLPVNTPTAFVSTSNNQVSVTSKGDEDTIITSTVINVNSLTATNTGSNTLNNTLNNINDSISTNFWNPQRNSISNIPCILTYTFTGTETPFKIFVRNLASGTYTFPGFNTIKMYPTNTPSNFQTITPSINVLNGTYNNETTILLLDDSSTPYFKDVNQMTLELYLNTTYTKPNLADYQFGPNTGIIYNALLNEGKYQTAVVNGGYIYRSEDYGVSWSPITTYSKNWSSVSVSSSGQYQTAVANGEYIYISQNYGVSWSPITIYSKNWKYVSISLNGQYQTAVSYGEYIYRSTDYGNSWSQLTSPGVNNWTSIAMSDDASYQYITISNGYIYKSTDYGVTWNSIVTSPIKNWSSISVSSDGSIVNAVVNGEYRYNSINYGVTWTSYNDINYLDNTGNYVNTTNPQNYTSICNNSSGVYAVCSVNGSELFNSYQLLNTMSARNGYSTLYWTSVSCSYSAKYVVACASNSVFYKSTDYGRTWSSTSSPSLNWSSISISKGYSSTNSTVSLKAGDYISYNYATGTIDQWTTPLFVNNYSTLTGTDINGNKNFMCSSDGNIQVSSTTVYSSNSYYSNDSGSRWNTQSGSTGDGTDDMVVSEDGQFSLYAKNGVNGSYSSALRQSNNFCLSRAINYTNNYPSINDVYYCAMSRNGKYQFFIGQYTVGTQYFGKYYFFFVPSIYNYNNSIYWTYRNFTSNVGTGSTYIGSFVYMNGDLTIIYNDTTTNAPLILNITQSSTYTSVVVTNLTSNTSVYSFDKNNNKNSSIDSKYITLIGWNSPTSQPRIYTINNGVVNFINLPIAYPLPYSPVNINNTAVKVSSTGQYQVVTFTYRYFFDGDNPSLIYYSNNYGATWTRTNEYYYINVLRAKSPFVANDDFSYITLCGGYAPRDQYNGSNLQPNYGNIIPFTYYSLDRGQTWSVNSSINPATQIELLAFYNISSVTNKTYFQIKDTNQTQVLGVSDNGFKMVKDLRVTNANGYVIGGTMTIGPDETSSLLNNYSLNVDGTISCRNVVTLSDKRFKNVVGDVSDRETYDKMDNINIIKYKYIDRKDDRIYSGMIAQDVYNVFEDAVDIKSSTYMNNEGNIEIPDVYSIRYNVIISYLISAFKGAKKEINLLKEELDQLKKNN